ncbi:histidine--tRNA ligase [Candidatus Parcubacteria bacterium]|nr:histidine--tRNA ligase [Candidatus Parcubacteria bacterium]
MKKLDTSSYKGVRDFYPEDMFVLDYIKSVWHEVLQQYGFEHYNASILEPSELYESKTSDEIFNEQTYSFVDRGNRKVTLRPEMTPTVSRMIAKKQRELSFPLRWYSIPNVFRYERPQKGRLREHWQLNADIFGIGGIDAEAEIIEIAYKIMTRFGLNESDFVIKINDRQILNQALDDLGLDEEKKKEFIRLLDKKDKVDDFNDKAFKILGKNYDVVIKPSDEIEKLTEKLNKRGIKNIVFDPNMVRGFDYYTGIVFEIFDTNPENRRSVFGGGRYDNLLEIFGANKLPTIGFGMGDVTIKDVLESRNLISRKITPAHVGIAIFDEESNDYAIKQADDLRKQGFDVLVHYPTKKIGDQIKFFDKKGVPFVVIIGQDEVKSKKVKLKYLAKGEEKELSYNQLVDFLKEQLDNK